MAANKMRDELLTSEDELEKRLTKFQNLLASNGVGGAIILQNADLFYFTGTIVQGFLYVPREGEPTFLIKRSYKRAEIESKLGNKIRISGVLHGCSILEDELKINPDVLGMELDVIPFNLYMLYKERFPKYRIVDISDLIKDCRKIKSPFEIDQMKKAAEIAKAAFAKIPSLIREGMTEIELSALIEYEIRRRGHQGLIRTRTYNMEFYFGPVVCGTSANYPTSFDGPVGAVGLYPGITQSASEKRLTKGEPIVVDFVTGYNGYQVDMARVFAIGSVPGKLLDAHNFVIDELVLACEAMIKPGVNGRDIYNKALQLAEKRGLCENFMGFGENKVKFIAHGIGLELDEIPILSGKIDVVLEPGMTFAFEPKVFLDDIGGAGVENTYLVTESGYENLTEFQEGIVVV